MTQKNTLLQFNELITNNVDVVALLGHAAHELSHLRREKLKPALKPAYHALCSSETPTASTKYLFGDDLAKQIRDAKETNRKGSLRSRLVKARLQAHAPRPLVA